MFNFLNFKICLLIKINNLLVMLDFKVPLITFIKGYQVMKRNHMAQSVSILIQLKHVFIVSF